MVVPDNWKDIEPKVFNNFRPLSLGGHICNIIEVKEYRNNRTGNETLKVMFDIEEKGEFNHYCQKLFDNNIINERKWPNEGTKYFPLDISKLGYLKHFISVLEKFNDIKIEVQPHSIMDLSQLNGLKFMGQFGLQEYKNLDGDLKTGVSLFSYSANKNIEDIQIPNVRLVDGSEISYEEYQNKRGIRDNNYQESLNLESEDIDIDLSEELPF